MDAGVSNRRNKGQNRSQLTVVARWQRSEEISPAFRRLMMVLLRERTENGEKTTRESTRPDYQMR